MPIGYKDFFPAVLKSGFFSTEHEALAANVARANAWVRASGVRIINVETVVLPNVDNEAATMRSRLHTSGEMGSDWYQIVRVWYEAPG